MIKHSRLVSEIFARTAETPEKAAVLSGDVRVTYGQLSREISTVAKYLIGLGLKPKDRVALAVKKNYEFILFYLAAHAVGLSSVVVDSESNPRRIQFMIDESRPAHLFGISIDDYPHSDYPTIESISGLAKKESFETDISEDDESDILFTTGTTGNPKGVVLSHRNIFSAVENINGFIGNETSDVEAIALPLCHSFGLGRLRCALVRGQTVVLLNGFTNLKKVFTDFERYSINGFGMVPSVWAYIEKFSGTRIAKFASQMRYIEIGSAPMPIESKRRLCELFPNTRICMHYGSTEASRSLFMEFHNNSDHLDSIGLPASSNVDVRIFDSEGDELPIGETGEICVKGDFTTQVPYLNEDNKTSFFGSFFRTGDLGYKAEDDFIYLNGRLKEMINVGGKKVSPQEVEEAICSQGAVDAVCVAMHDPNGILGEVVKAYILRDGCSIDFQTITAGLRRCLEPYKIPVVYEWIDKIPKTSSGKKKRLALKDDSLQ